MKIYSQRDPKWASNLMGTGTLGQLGCTITCLSMISEISPDVLNNEIKQVGGYSGNYIIWEKLDSIKGFDFIKRVRVYENTEVVANLPCLVEVNGAPIGGTTHWVLYIGNKKLWDPWTGTEKSTSAYLPIGYSVIKYKKESDIIQPTPMITAQTKIPQVIDENGNPMEVQAIVSSIKAKNEEILSLKITVQALNDRLTILEQETPQNTPSEPTDDATQDTSNTPSLLSRLWTRIKKAYLDLISNYD